VPTGRPPARRFVVPDLGYARLDYVRRKLTKTKHVYIAETGRYGPGIFAAAPFREGRPIVVDEDGDYYDGAVTEAEALALGLDLSAHCFQIGEDRYLLPHGSIDDLINHACEPSAGIRLTERGYRLIALREIAAGEEITYDYSTYITNPRERLLCGCGAFRCRREIGPFRDLPARLRRFYLERGVVGAFAALDAERAHAEAALPELVKPAA
jgi:uncharacterized protein